MSSDLENGLATARQAAARPVMLEEQAALEEAAEHWLEADAMGVDTEFVRERTFFAQPGLIQLSDGVTVWLLDPIAVPDLSPLRRLLDCRRCPKILHSAGEDLEVLRQLTGSLPDPLFDTQIAAALTGRPMQLAYERLVGDLLSETLPGGMARSNWLQRPLPVKLLGYAAQDVAFLPLMRIKLNQELEARERLEWMLEDCARVVSTARNPPGADDAWLRIRGATRLEDDDACHRLMLLAAWREEQATKRDRPRRFIISDETLLEIARRAPQEFKALQAVGGVSELVLRRYGEALVELGRQRAPEGFSRPAEFGKLGPEQREKLHKLQQEVRLIAGQLELEAPVIASKRELVGWLQNKQPDWLAGWRGHYLAPL